MRHVWKITLAIAILLLLAACDVGPSELPTDTPEPTAKPTIPAFTPPPDAKFRIGQRVFLKNDAFVVQMADDPAPLDGSGPGESCYTNVYPTVLAIVMKNGVIYYLLDCDGYSQGWLPESKLDGVPGR